MSYVFVGDSNSDLPYAQAEAKSIEMIAMPYMLGDREDFADGGRNPENLRAFYAAMRAGASAKTSLLPVDFYLDFFEPYLKRGDDILYIAFSFQLSQTQQNALRAARALLDHYPERRIEIVDTLSISMGYGILLYEAACLRESGASMDEVKAFVEEKRTRAQHWFSVEDLVYLKRGGRLGGASAMVGTLLDVKPLLNMTRDGRLVSVEKTKGRKKALRTLVQRALESLDKPQETIVTILNADCMQDAVAIEGMIREAVAVKDIWHVPVGQVICTHCGPGTIGIVFIGKERTAG